MAFSSQGDRIALTQIEQMIDGKYIILGHYDTQADNLTWTGLEKWHDNKVSFPWLFYYFVGITCGFVWTPRIIYLSFDTWENAIPIKFSYILGVVGTRYVHRNCIMLVLVVNLYNVINL